MNQENESENWRKKSKRKTWKKPRDFWKPLFTIIGNFTETRNNKEKCSKIKYLKFISYWGSLGKKVNFYIKIFLATIFFLSPVRKVKLLLCYFCCFSSSFLNLKNNKQSIWSESFLLGTVVRIFFRLACRRHYWLSGHFYVWLLWLLYNLRLTLLTFLNPPSPENFCSL